MAFKCLLEHTYIYIYTYIHNSEYQWDFFPQDWEHEQKKWSPMSSVVMRVLGDHRGSSGIIGFWDCWITIIIDSIAPDIVVNDGRSKHHAGVSSFWVSKKRWKTYGYGRENKPGWWFQPLSKIVSRDDDIPNIWKNTIHVPNHQPDVNVLLRWAMELTS